MNSILVPHYVKYKRNANGGDSIRQLSGVTCHFNQFHACVTYAVSQVNEFVFSVCLTFGVRFQTANKYRFAVAVAATFLKYSSQLYRSNILNTTPNCYDIGAIHLQDCMYYLHRCKYTIFHHPKAWTPLFSGFICVYTNRCELRAGFSELAVGYSDCTKVGISLWYM